jgi:drug/metabolite transporter (DMT)-like permease
MWFWYAISASVLWGLNYVGNQYLLKFLSAFEILFLESLLLAVILFIWFYFNHEVKDVFLKLNNLKVAGAFLTCATIYVLAVFCIFKSITLSNASYAAIIEACYPIFTMIFAYLILGEVQFSLTSLIGCGFILAGLAIINIR